MRTPGSTRFSEWTNLAYVLAGVVAIFFGHATSILVGGAFIALGVLSWRYHHLYNIESQLGDEIGMYLAFGTLAGVPLYLHLPDPWSLTAFCAMFAVSIIAAFVAKQEYMNTMWTMPAWFLMVVVGLWVTANLQTALFYLTWFAFFAFVREMPEYNFSWASKYAKPHYDWYHGVWHVGTGVGMALIYLTEIGIIGHFA